MAFGEILVCMGVYDIVHVVFRAPRPTVRGGLLSITLGVVIMAASLLGR